MHPWHANTHTHMHLCMYVFYICIYACREVTCIQSYRYIGTTMHRRNAGQIRSWMATEDPTRRDRVSTRVCVCVRARERGREHANPQTCVYACICLHACLCMCMLGRPMGSCIYVNRIYTKQATTQIDTHRHLYIHARTHMVQSPCIAVRLHTVTQR